MLGERYPDSARVLYAMAMCLCGLLTYCCRLNMGTADELAMDVLINALSTLSKECATSLRAWKLRHFGDLLLLANGACGWVQKRGHQAADHRR